MSPATETKTRASASKTNEDVTSVVTNEVIHQKDENQITQSASGRKQIEKKSSGGIFSCFRGSKVTDVDKDDAYKKATANDGKISTFHISHFDFYVIFNVHVIRSHIEQKLIAIAHERISLIDARLFC